MYISLPLPVIKIAACHAISLADDVYDGDVLGNGDGGKVMPRVEPKLLRLETCLAPLPTTLFPSTA